MAQILTRKLGFSISGADIVDEEEDTADKISPKAFERLCKDANLASIKLPDGKTLELHLFTKYNELFSVENTNRMHHIIEIIARSFLKLGTKSSITQEQVDALEKQFRIEAILAIVT